MCTAARGINPVIVALNADYPVATELIVAADLNTTHPAIDVVAGKQRSRAGGLPPILVPPKPAAVAADIAAGPVVDRDHRGRRLGVNPGRQVGGNRRSGEASHDQPGHAGEKCLHGKAPLKWRIPAQFMPCSPAKLNIEWRSYLRFQMPVTRPPHPLSPDVEARTLGVREARLSRSILVDQYLAMTGPPNL
jgi:hypothetical protein